MNAQMRKLVAFGATFALLFGLAGLNPSLNYHRDEIAQAYAQENPVSGELGVGEALATVSEYNNYVFFSTTTAGGRQMSVGGIGFVRATPPTATELPRFVMKELPPPIRSKVMTQLPRWMQDQMEVSN